MILSVVTGALAGLAAVVLKSSVHWIQHELLNNMHWAIHDYVIYLYPLLGIVLTVICANYVLKSKLGHGISGILFSISQKSSIIQRMKMYSGMITSAITVGFGGSVGLEAPIVVTGSAIGSNVARFMHLDYKSRTILVGCGAAGAIAGIFNSPVTGVIFASEVILAGIGFASFIPLLIAAVCGSLVSKAFLGGDIMFSFEIKDAFSASDVPFYILLGIFCGMVSVYFTRVFYFVEMRVHKIKNILGRGAFGGLVLAIIIFVFPPIYGEGYDTIKSLLTSNSSDIIYQSFFSLNYDNSFVFHPFSFWHHPGQAFCFGTHHRIRWQRRYICAFAVSWWGHWVFPGFCHQPDFTNLRGQFKQFHLGGHVWRDERCAPCPVDSHLPHCRNYWRLYPFCAPHARVGHQL